MFKFGLKLWSINECYVEEALRLLDEKYFDFIELYIIPGSYEKYSGIWTKINVPYVIHAPHFREGLNLAKPEKKDKNLIYANESIKFANLLNSEVIIFHPGISGEVEETIRQINNLNDKRIVIENKPYYALQDGLICNGNSVEEIKLIINNTNIGFCLDIGHAFCSANARNILPLAYLKEFINLNPKIFHLTDGDICSIFDKHEHFGNGNYNIKEILNILPYDSMITVETVKNSKESLVDFQEDITYLRKIINER